ncbi:MAG: hypothetical protein FWD93_04235 [Coriobacteriia bacterium]|nr:hypothetical protein [Coriobacteriia bacterium]
MNVNTKKLPLQASRHIQLLFAALLWLIGAGFILRMAMIYLAQIGNEVWWVPPLGMALGLLKAYWLMIPSAAKSIERIREKGRDWILNCFSLRTYLMIGGMIILGIALRIFGPTDTYGYQVFLSILYLTVGVGLFISIGTFLAALRRGIAIEKSQKA